MPNFIAKIFAILLFTIKRLTAQRGMALTALCGIIAAEALAMSIPIYADTAYQKLLDTRIEETVAETGTSISRPPFSMLYRYLGAWYEPIQVEKFKTADAYLFDTAAQSLGLPVELTTRYLQAGIFGLYPLGNGSYASSNKIIDLVRISCLSGLEAHIQLLDGHFPLTGTQDTTDPVEVLVHQALADQSGIQVGDIYSAQTQVDKTKPPVAITVRIAGIWRELDAQDSYWYYGVSALEKDLIVSETAMFEQVAQVTGERFYEVAWYWVLDGSRLKADQVPGVIAQIEQTRDTANRLLPKAILEISPIRLLSEYQASSQALGLYLSVFSLPLLLMILIFISQTANTWVAQRKNEIAVLRSRGVTTLQIIGMAALENLLLGMLGLTVSIFLARGFVILFCQATGFLQFSLSGSKTIYTSQTGLQTGLLLLVVIIAAQVIPTVSASRYSVISYKQERARQLSRPWWQRTWLDLLLLLPSGYGLYLLRKQGSLVTPEIITSSSVGSILNPDRASIDPLLLLLPALCIFAITLSILRLLPYIMYAFTWAASKTSSVGLLMAVRYLSRAPVEYHAPVILLVLTLSLSTYTASMAQTLDRHLHDTTYYRVGADIKITESAQQDNNGSWELLPVSEHLNVSGVEAAARVREANISLQDIGEGKAAGYFGLDRVDFPRSAFWRKDFAVQSLGAMMNALAKTPDGVFISSDLAANYGFQVGDIMRARTFEAGEEYHLSFEILGTFWYFPTWYPGGTSLLVGNLENYMEQVGRELPYNVWLKTDPQANSDNLIDGVKHINKSVLYAETASEALAQERDLPERQGFFGLLSVGFAALGLLSTLGFLLYSVTSFKRRMVELGMLRAIGLSTGQMMALLAAELLFLFGIGLAAGTVLGVWISNQIIPLLQIEHRVSAQVPPFLVEINWTSVFQVYFLFFFMFAAAMIFLMILLLRMKIFKAIKLGETI